MITSEGYGYGLKREGMGHESERVSFDITCSKAWVCYILPQNS